MANALNIKNKILHSRSSYYEIFVVYRRVPFVHAGKLDASFAEGRADTSRETMGWQGVVAKVEKQSSGVALRTGTSQF